MTISSTSLDRQRRTFGRSLLAACLFWPVDRDLFAAASGDALEAGMRRETREITGFDQVEWNASGELEITQGPVEFLVLEAEPEVLRDIVAAVKGRTLAIGFRPGSRVQTRKPIRFKLSARHLEQIRLGGSGDVRLRSLAASSLALSSSGSASISVDSLQAERLDVRCDGSSSFQFVSGRVARQTVELAGSCQYMASKLPSREAEVTISGSGVVQVAAERSLVARISGSGSIEYLGDPKVTQEITGAGQVSRG